MQICMKFQSLDAGKIKIFCNVVCWDFFPSMLGPVVQILIKLLAKLMQNFVLKYGKYINFFLLKKCE